MADTGLISETEGSTATVSLMVNDDLYVAYVGDTAAIFIKSHESGVIRVIEELDTAEDNSKEVERVEKAGGVVLKAGHTARVQGELALTRSLGATKYKPYVTAEPHLIHYKLSSENCKEEFFVIGTDGLWKVVSPEDVAKIVNESKGLPENEIAEKLYEEAVRRNSTDNITITVVNLAKRAKMKKEGMFGPPAVPTSRYTKENKKAFLFPAESSNLID